MEKHVSVKTSMCVSIPWEELDQVFLSVPGWDHLAGGEGFVRHSPGGVANRKREYDYRQCCQPYEEHARHIELANDQTLLILGARNLGNNLGFVAYNKDATPKVLHLSSEPFDRMPYPCLCWIEQDGQMMLTIETALFPDEEHIDLPSRKKAKVHWAVSGQPVLWDGQIPSRAELTGQTYDLRHIFHILDKEALAATEAERCLIRRDMRDLDALIRIYMENLDRSAEDRGSEILAAAEAMGLHPQHGYLHSSIGISDDGAILQMRHGSLENIGQAQSRAGARRALLLDNGGSCGYWLSSLETRFVASSTYFRPLAISTLAFRLTGRIVESPFRPQQRNLENTRDDTP